MESEKPASRRRRYSEEQKLQVLAECDAGGASVAKVAMACGINANVVHRWRKLACDTMAPRAANAGQFLIIMFFYPPMLMKPIPTSFLRLDEPVPFCPSQQTVKHGLVKRSD